MEDPLNDFKNWYKSFPPFTRYYISCIFILTCVDSLRLINSYYFYYDIDSAFWHLQLWRVITGGMYFGRFDLSLLMMLFFVYHYLSKLQTDIFDRKTYSDFLWLITIAWTLLLLISPFFNIKFFGMPFMFIMVYIHCRRRPFQQVRLLFYLRVKNGYLPWILIGISALMGYPLTPFLVALAIGHGYIFVKDVLTIKHHRDYLATPLFFKNLVHKYILKTQIAAPNNQGFQPFAGRGFRMD